ncbi:hypothetical protein [Rothia sp. HMSC08A08]|uniref:hypothetical protein n=1 Tax=Rothia sp. HMSC08A08 TaxID=1581132 RepID=UPI0008A1BA6B|nr:hypothetical protein [Rothia sp. HMSC08A08]OFS77829.1 hypothetical protein HMPREF3164_10025 [Rothia sp. HMSC08A08]
MKKTVQIMGIVAAIFLIIGFGLFILAGWGSLVEYHALEWRSVQHKGASPLTRATGNLSYWFLGTGFLTGFIALIPFFTTAIRNSRKTHKKYPKQAQDLLKDGQNQVDS